MFKRRVYSEREGLVMVGSHIDVSRRVDSGRKGKGGIL